MVHADNIMAVYMESKLSEKNSNSGQGAFIFLHMFLGGIC